MYLLPDTKGIVEESREYISSVETRSPKKRRVSRRITNRIPLRKLVACSMLFEVRGDTN